MVGGLWRKGGSDGHCPDELDRSARSREQALIFPQEWIPSPAVWRNDLDAWTYSPFNTFLTNTRIVTGVATIGQIFSASLFANGLVRLRFPGRDPLFLLLLATTMLPDIVTLVPQDMLV